MTIILCLFFLMEANKKNSEGLAADKFNLILVNFKPCALLLINFGYLYFPIQYRLFFYRRLKKKNKTERLVTFQHFRRGELHPNTNKIGLLTVIN